METLECTSLEYTSCLVLTRYDFPPTISTNVATMGNMRYPEIGRHFPYVVINLGYHLFRVIKNRYSEYDGGARILNVNSVYDRDYLRGILKQQGITHMARILMFNE
jgi:hypothetical protein